MSLLWTVASVLLSISRLTESSSVNQAQVLKKKWTVDSVIRDVEMHDFDDNGGLDGIEIRAALNHRMEHLSEEEAHEAVDVEQMVEEFINIFDKNNDGVVDYAEFRFEKIN
ncbi:hypothetical protein JTE90_025110 [Oedothorax gibbosus]|uniref:EF-hand domain-containing protein n=1 Tax=Oedothorax gibbosus TaxID=931172 RepID=A0AAV6U3W1_9ARAC|nr:hypothetical protein JTE90_025110 [Oedothorax gibbosus]